MKDFICLFCGNHADSSNWIISLEANNSTAICSDCLQNFGQALLKKLRSGDDHGVMLVSIRKEDRDESSDSLSSFLFAETFKANHTENQHPFLLGLTPPSEAKGNKGPKGQ